MSELHRSVEDILDDCITAIERGEATVESCLVAYPQHEAELRGLLNVMMVFESAPAIIPSADSRANHLEDILQQPQAKTQKAWWERLWARCNEQLPPHVAWALMAFMVLFLGLSGLGVAADSAVPGDKLYGIDRGVESVRMGLVLSEQSRVNLLLAQAEERLVEAGILSEREESVSVQLVLDDYDATLAGVIEAVFSADSNTTAAFDTTIITHSKLLEAIDKTHPVTQQIVDEYSVTAAEVDAWREMGYGFGEIKLALATSAETGQTPDELFIQNAEGESWDEIVEQERERSKREAEIRREAAKESAEATREAEKANAEATRETEKANAEATREAEKVNAEATREAEREQENQ